MQPGALVRIKPEYEGYGCHGLAYIVSVSFDAQFASEIDTHGYNSDYLTHKTYKVYVTSIDRIMTFFEYELDVVAE